MSTSVVWLFRFSHRLKSVDGFHKLNGFIKVKSGDVDSVTSAHVNAVTVVFFRRQNDVMMSLLF